MDNKLAKIQTVSTTIYSFYNNKGGVGKTTICSNTATLYAKNHPEDQVLVIDMCPQANISQFLLGGGEKGYRTNQQMQQFATRKNIVGFVEWLLQGNSSKKPTTKYRIRVSSHNGNISKNLYLIAGDSFLESFSLALNYAVINPANTRAWSEYMTAIRRLCESEFDNKLYKDLVVFIDCNPSFSIYTQMALVSSDRLLVPMMADFSSVEGIKGICMLLYGKYPSAALKRYAENVITFNKQVESFDIELPKFWGFIFNNYTIKDGVATAYGSIRTELIDFCYEQYKEFDNLFANNHKKFTNKKDWEDFYISDIKDFHTAGKVSSSLGIPLFELPEHRKYNMPDGTEVTVDKKRYEQALANINNFVAKIP